MDENADANQVIFEPPPESWRRPPGCPRTTWTKTTQGDLSLPWIWSCTKPENWLRIDLPGNCCLRIVIGIRIMVHVTIGLN